jgi:DNA-binding NtrC family response regulator
MASGAAKRTTGLVVNGASSTTLPGAARSAAVVHPASSTQRAASQQRRSTVLLIDDEPAFLRSLELVLEDTHDVVVCGRSPEALELVRANPERFDAILCDLSMPVIDGVAFHRQMEALGIASRFVLMTAGAFTTHGEEFLRQAKCTRIGKPFTLDKVLSVLAAVGAR